MKGKPVLKPLELFGIGDGKKVIYNGEWGSNVIYTIVKTFPQLTYCDLQNNALLTYKDILSAHISELSQIVIEYIGEEEVTNPVIDKEYHNLYDGRIWKYRPSPCPMPFWANTGTLREIKQVPLSPDDYELVMAGGHCSHCADIDLEASFHITERCSSPACLFVSDGSMKKEVEFEVKEKENKSNLFRKLQPVHYFAKIKK